MGSARAGARAGAASGLFFSGVTAGINTLVLLADKSQIISTFATSPSTCPISGATNSTIAAQRCFSNLLTAAIPFFFFSLLAISLLGAIFFGIYFEFIPGRSYLRKALLLALVVLVVLLNIAIPVAATVQQEILMIVVELVTAVGYAVILARLYRRYTREVEFQSVDPSKIKIMIGNRDQTGKKRTYPLNAKQVVSVTAEGRPFKGWVVSGGVSVDDSRARQTEMTVVGDGLLKAT